MLNFQAKMSQVANTYQVEFFNKSNTPIFRFETTDYALAERTVQASKALFLKWQFERKKQTGEAGWATFAMLCDAMFYPTRTGGHAIIYTEIENSYL